MPKVLALALALVLGGCAAAPENKVSVTIRNATAQPLVVRCGGPVFGTSVVIPAGTTWSGEIDRRLVPSSGWVIIEPLGK